MALEVLIRNTKLALIKSLKRDGRCFSSSYIRQGKEVADSYWHQPGLEPLTHLTVGQLVDVAAEKWGDRESIVSLHQAKRLTFKECRHQANMLAAGFQEIGLEPGDRLGIWGPNSIEWYISNLAAARVGLITVNINPAYQAAELLTCLNQVGVKALVAANRFKTQNYYDIVQRILPEVNSSSPGQLMSELVPSLKSLIMMTGEEQPGSYKYDDVLNSASQSAVDKILDTQRKIQPDQGCNIQFTSGTTGKSKATLLSHHNMVNNSYIVGKNIGLHLKHHRICVNVPFFHCFGNVVSILCALHHGSTLIIPDASFVASKSVTAIRDEKCTVLYGTPTMYCDMLAAVTTAVNQRGQLDGAVIEVAVNGGAPCSPQLFTRLMETFRLKRVCSIYGMTETSPVVFQSYLDDTFEEMTTTVGHVHEHMEVKVVDKEGRMVPMGSAGELMVRGYSTMLGYWNQDDQTKETVGRDRWLRTGDQFILRDDGYGLIVGRIKDIIIRGGENIFPKEVEQFLETHSKIREVQVFGIPHLRLGEEVCASIRLEEGASLTIDEVIAFCKGDISHYKIPRHIRIVPDFPKTVSGKIQKFRLREMLMQDLQSSSWN